MPVMAGLTLQKWRIRSVGRLIGGAPFDSGYLGKILPRGPHKSS